MTSEAQPAEPARVRIGTSGWSYPTGRGAWVDVFYPSPQQQLTRSGEHGDAAEFVLTPPTAARRPSRLATRARTFDELAYYAEHFDTVEVNSTFYRVPTPAVVAGWARRTPPGFEFAIKLYQKLTHPAMAAAPEPASKPTVADVDTFRHAIDPVASAGKLGPILVQFPPSFRMSSESAAYLDWLLGTFRDYTMAVELRHRTWSDQTAATLDLLNSHEAAWVQIDEPKFRFSIRQDLLPNVRGLSYMRLHGRNADKWWKHDAAEDRYDYLYSAEELEPFAEAAQLSRRLVKKLYLYMNNHFEAKAVANAVMLKQRLGEPIEGEYPPGFVDRYPQLAGVVRVATSPPPSRTSS